MRKIFLLITYCLLVGLVFSFGGGKLLIQQFEYSTNEETIQPYHKQGDTSVLGIVWGLFSDVSEEAGLSSIRIHSQSNIKQCDVESLSFNFLLLKTIEVVFFRYRSPFLYFTCDYYVFALRKILI